MRELGSTSFRSGRTIARRGSVLSNKTSKTTLSCSWMQLMRSFDTAKTASIPENRYLTILVPMVSQQADCLSLPGLSTYPRDGTHGRDCRVRGSCRSALSEW